MDHQLHAYCPTCNVQVELKETGSYRKLRPVDESVDPDGLLDIPWIAEDYVLCNCPKCESPFLFKREWYEIPAEFSRMTSEPELLYPSASRLPPTSLPPSIAKSYQTAIRSLEVGLYEPCLIMCRKCLEAICRQHAISKGNLKSKLTELTQQGIIDMKLHSWTDGLRLVANDAAHEFDIEVHHEDAKDSVEFIEAVISYIFILGKKFEEFQKRRKKEAD